MSSSPVCTTAEEVVWLAFEVMVTICTSIPIGIWTMHKYRRNHATSPLFLYRLVMAFYFFCILYMFCAFLGSIVRCFNYLLVVLFFRIRVTAYIVRWALILAIYLGRLHIVFRGTAFEASGKSIKCFIVCFVVAMLFITCIEVMRYVSYNFVFNLFGYMLSLIMLGSLNIALCVFFIKRLNKLRNIEDNKETGSSDGRIFALLAKYTILSIFSCATTWASVLCLFSMVFLPPHLASAGILVSNLLSVMDVFSDIVCMTFTFSFAERGYQKLCGCCDRNMRRIYGNDGDEAHIRSIVMSENGTSTTGGATTSEKSGRRTQTNMNTPSAASTEQAGSVDASEPTSMSA